MNKEYDNEKSRRTSYELIVQGNEDTSNQQGEPDLVLRRKPLDKSEEDLESAHGQDTLPESEQDVNSTSEHDHIGPIEDSLLDGEAVVEAPDGPADSGKQITDYIASLSHYVPEDVSRVVDEIIAEENKLPTGLPTLDESMSVIYSNAEEELPVEDEEEEEQPSSNSESGEDNTQHYTNKVEYEDR